MTRSLSGEQLDITGFGYTATIATVGATLRRLEHGGRDLVRPFDADEVRVGYRGAVLAPWPNRVVDGTWELDGVEQILPLTEPARGHALHGLAAWLDFTVEVHESHRVVLTARIEAQTGYPAALSVQVAYELGELGLRWSVTAEHLGGPRVPWGTGPHPYLLALAPGADPHGGRVDDWTLALPAAKVLTVDPVRLIPQGLEDAAAHGFDFRSPRAIGSTEIDHAFTDVSYDSDGIASATVTDAAGWGAGMCWHRDSPWVQVHTADLPDPALSRRGLALEPMTCPPDAYHSGTDLVWLEPGDTSSVSWWIFAVSPE